MSDDESKATPASDSDTLGPLPPASFPFLVLSLKMQAEMQLGLLHFGDEGEQTKPELRLARHTIDILAVLAEKTKGNLDLDEQRLIENTLTELRFRYIQVTEQSTKQTAG